MIIFLYDIAHVCNTVWQIGENSKHWSHYQVVKSSDGWSWTVSGEQTFKPNLGVARDIISIRFYTKNNFMKIKSKIESIKNICELKFTFEFLIFI